MSCEELNLAGHFDYLLAKSGEPVCYGGVCRRPTDSCVHGVACRLTTQDMCGLGCCTSNMAEKMSPHQMFKGRVLVLRIIQIPAVESLCPTVVLVNVILCPIASIICNMQCLHVANLVRRDN